MSDPTAHGPSEEAVARAYERGLEDSRDNTREIIAEVVERVRAEMRRHENGTTCVVLSQLATAIEREFTAGSK